VRRIFTMGLPYPHTSYSYQHHGGQILFWPSDSDGYLYLVTGNGDFSKNGRSFFGKILRFYVGGMAGMQTLQHILIIYQHVSLLLCGFRFICLPVISRRKQMDK